MHEATLHLLHPPAIARAIAGALAPEAAEAPASRDVPRTSVAIEIVHDGLVIRIEAEEIATLRAALNSYARWADAAERAARAAGIA